MSRKQFLQCLIAYESQNRPCASTLPVPPPSLCLHPRCASTLPVVLEIKADLMCTLDYVKVDLGGIRVWYEIAGYWFSGIRLLATLRSTWSVVETPTTVFHDVMSHSDASRDLMSHSPPSRDLTSHWAPSRELTSHWAPSRELTSHGFAGTRKRSNGRCGW
jgi:hypothetical protein